MFIRMFFRSALALGLCLAAWWPEPAAAERRIALVIGNGGYQHTAGLRNPSHDAQDLSAALKRLGFEVVEGIDLDKRAMERTIRQFGVKLAGADIALFFYAGHGLQVSGQNYLLPTDARLSTEGDVDFETVALNLVLKQMEREAKTSLLLLDACRDNPLARNLARTMGTRSPMVGQGLAEVKTGVGTLIGFSTQPGNVALDGTGRNSPYATALLKHIESRDADISSILIDVRSDVVKVTNGHQVPWEHTSLMGRVIFSPSATHPAPTPAASASPNYDKEMELAFWNAVKDSKTPELLRTYVDRFPNGTFANLAAALIAQAARDKAASVAGSRTEAAKPDEKTVAAASPSLAAPAPPAQPAPAQPAQDESPAALIRSIQTELTRLGCEPGKEDGKWGANVRDALERFNKATSSAIALDGPKRETLAALAGQTGRICPLQCARNEEAQGDRCVAKARREPAPYREPASTRETRDQPERKRTQETPSRRESTDNAACAEWRRCTMVIGRGFEGRCGLAPKGC